MHYAAQNDRVECAQVLLSHGAALLTDRDGWTALHIACLNGSCATAQLVLQAQPAAARQLTADGDSANMIARAHGHDELADMLPVVQLPSQQQTNLNEDEEDEENQDEMDTSD